MRSSTLSKHLHQLLITAAISAALTCLALIAQHTLTTAAATPNSLLLTPHSIYLPFVARQESPTPPLYQLSIDPADLAWLYANPRTDETVPGILTHRGASYGVEVRFRGATARDLPKKSWKIEFPASALFQGQRELNLNAEYTDKSLLREMLSYDLLKRLGLPAPRANFARLEVNGSNLGLFVQVEQVDQRLLQRIGWDPNGNLYKGNYGNFEESNDYLAYQASYLKKTNKEDSHDDIIALVEMVNRTPESDLPAALAQVLDVGEYLDWLAVQIVLGNFEWVEKNYYIYHQLQQDRWAFLPWDLDLLLGHNWSWEHDILDPDISWDNPVDSGTWWSKKADGRWNKLTTEVLRGDDFKFAYCRRLWDLIEGEFAPELMAGRIDALHALATPYAEADLYKWGSNSDFHNGPAELKTYVTQRVAWLSQQLPLYCPQDGPFPLLNELMSANSSTLRDEAGEYEPWIELYNPGLVSFDVGGMSLQLGALRWTIPQRVVIPPGGFLLLWADGEPHEGPLHASFRLDAGGGALELLDQERRGGQAVDQSTFGPLGLDISFGRQDDGGEYWLTFSPSTPGWSNRGRAPLITGTLHTPAEPGAGQAVTVSASVSAELAGLSVALHWSSGGAAQVSPMSDGGGGRYSAVIPGLGSGTVVTYYVQAEDAAGLSSTDPPSPRLNVYRYVVGFERPPLYLNELVAVNEDTFEDEAGDSDDWFEIYNSGDATLELGGLYLTDAIENSTKWQIPAGVSVPPGGHVLFWADGEVEQGATHVNFSLSGDGERLALYADAQNLIDELYYGPQTVDQPLGRYPDGADAWRVVVPTPGQANRQPAPTFSQLHHWPASPLPTQAVTVSVVIQDEGAVLSATLYYSVSLGGTLQGDLLAAPMQRTVGDWYSARIPPQPSGAVVSLYVLAQDDQGAVGACPADSTLRYQVGHYQPPPLFINEFLADNQTINQDEQGEYEDWIELYNAGDAPLDVGGMYLTDDLSQPTQWRIPDGTLIPARGFVLIWADAEAGDGPLHANFKLGKSGEAVGLFDQNNAANALIDSLVFDAQQTDVSSGRLPDGGEVWTTFSSPTPGWSNTTLAPPRGLPTRGEAPRNLPPLGGLRGGGEDRK